jgi:hypothetical protein
MALSFGTAGNEQIATGVVGCHWLVEMDFLQLYRGLHLEHLVLDLLD